MIPFIVRDWHLQHGIIHTKSEKLLQAISETLNLCQNTTLHRHATQRTVGRLTWLSMGLRTLLSVLFRTFHFICNEAITSATLETSRIVSAELEHLVTFLPLLQIQLRRPLWTLIIAFDASETAGAVVCADVELRSVLRLHELILATRLFIHDGTTLERHGKL